MILSVVAFILERDILYVPLTTRAPFAQAAICSAAEVVVPNTNCRPDAIARTVPLHVFETARLPGMLRGRAHGVQIVSEAHLAAADPAWSGRRTFRPVRTQMSFSMLSIMASIWALLSNRRIATGLNSSRRDRDLRWTVGDGGIGDRDQECAASAQGAFDFHAPTQKLGPLPNTQQSESRGLDERLQIEPPALVGDGQA